MVNYLNISEFIAPILNLIITIPLNFLLNKFWAFR
jgi:putative flippase GtrA